MGIHRCGFILKYSTQTWLAPPARGTLLEYVVLPYLRATENLLKRIQNRTDVVSAATACMFTAVQFTMDMYPSLAKSFESKMAFGRCGEILHAVAKKERISRWYEEHWVRERVWTLSPFGTVEWVRAEGRKFERVN